MNENDNEQQLPETIPQLTVNDLGLTTDSTVVVEEANRTVVLKPDETIIIEKTPRLDIPPSNRPRKVYKGMWGTTEIAALGVSLFTIFGVLVLYLFFVVPSNNELEAARLERDKLEKDRNDAQTKYGGITSTQQRVADLIASVDNFESSYLPIASNGRTAIYQRINGLIAGYGLTNTSGPDYAPLELEAQQTQSTDESGTSGRERYLSIFPGVYVTMTVEGPYQNIRRFIREVETGREFVLISSVEIEPAETRQLRAAQQAAQTAQADPQFQPQDPTRGSFPGINQFPNNPNVQQPNAARPPQGRTMGDVVSLRLEMAAYFQRPTAAAVSVAPAQ